MNPIPFGLKALIHKSPGSAVTAGFVGVVLAVRPSVDREMKTSEDWEALLNQHGFSMSVKETLHPRESYVAYEVELTRPVIIHASVEMSMEVPDDVCEAGEEQVEEYIREAVSRNPRLVQYHYDHVDEIEPVGPTSFEWEYSDVSDVDEDEDEDEDEDF